MSILGVLRMYGEFALGWCASGCKSVRVILVIGGILIVCVSYCVVYELWLLDVGVRCEKYLLV